MLVGSPETRREMIMEVAVTLECRAAAADISTAVSLRGGLRRLGHLKDTTSY